MSKIIHAERLNHLPTPTTPDTIYLLAHAPGELKIALTNANNTLIYETVCASEVGDMIEAKLAEPGGVLALLQQLLDMAHEHPDLIMLNNIDLDDDGYLRYNGISLSPILTEEAW